MAAFGDFLTNVLLAPLQGIASLGTSIYNIIAGERQFKEQQKLNEQSVEMANTQTSRGLADAHAAGLSTSQWLSMNGAQSGTPSLSAGNLGQAQAPDIMSPWLRKKELDRQEKLYKLQEDEVNARIAKTEAETESIKQNTEHSSMSFDYEYGILEEELKAKQLENKYNPQILSSTGQKLQNEVEKVVTETQIEKDEHQFNQYMHMLEYGNSTGRNVEFHIGYLENGRSVNLVVPDGWTGWKQEMNTEQLINMMNANELQSEQIKAIQDSVRNGTVKNIGDLLLKLLDILVKWG